MASLIFFVLILIFWSLQGCTERTVDQRWESVTIVEQRLGRILAWAAGTPQLHELHCASTVLQTKVQALRECDGNYVASKLGALATAIQGAAFALEGAARSGEPHCDVMGATK